MDGIHRDFRKKDDFAPKFPEFIEHCGEKNGSLTFSNSVNFV